MAQDQPGRPHETGSQPGSGNPSAATRVQHRFRGQSASSGRYRADARRAGRARSDAAARLGPLDQARLREALSTP